MSAVAFDTLKYAEALRGAGLTPEQAEKQSKALAEVLSEREGGLATRADLALLESKIDRVLDQLATMRWVLVSIVLAQLAVFIRAFWPLAH